MQARTSCHHDRHHDHRTSKIRGWEALLRLGLGFGIHGLTCNVRNSGAKFRLGVRTRASGVMQVDWMLQVRALDSGSETFWALLECGYAACDHVKESRATEAARQGHQKPGHLRPPMLQKSTLYGD